ncbi:TATA box-binding protein-associated factor, RNA polymerase I, subunit C isoform 1-T1 [Anableps anableps]
MDYQFPQQLFPSFYNCGPPNLVLKHSAGGWGTYDGVLAQGGTGSLSSWTFTSKRQIQGEIWRQMQPVPVPLLPPRKAFQGHVTPPDPLDFLAHMQNFFMDHGPDAFRCTSEILGDNFFFRKAKTKEKYWQDSANMWKTKGYVDLLKYKICPITYPSKSLNKYSSLLWDVIHDIPPELLGSLLHEELTEQRDRMQFSEGATGGALAFVPFSQSEGCLLYPGGLGMDRLNFHKVALQHHSDDSSWVDASSRDLVSFQLKAPIRQISCGSLFSNCCVAVRSDHLCGVWRFSERIEPCLLQVVNTKAAATCVSVSPHILGDVLVASESGAANLWTVGRGMQKIRAEESNLYFNAKSSWRWCEFSAHPRVMLYADRTGAELTDFRLKVGSSQGHTLFRISSTSDCQSGERLLLCRYLGEVHPFHHLLTTQHSAYIMDERFPCIPMLKWDHMMEAPPLFCHVALDRAAGGTTKVLLGSQSSQEITLLQYSGGGVEACCSRGPPQALLRPTDSLRLLPVQIPHRQQTAADRLASPAAGLTCFQNAPGPGERMCVLQLTEAGDIFAQVLERRRQNEEATERLPAHSQQLLISDTSSDEDVVMPSQAPAARTLVPETPERNLRSDSSCEESEARSRIRKRLQVFVNEEPDSDRESRPDAEASGGNKEAAGRSCCGETPAAPSSTSIQTWKRWLQRLMQTGQGKKPAGLRLFTVRTEGLLRVGDGGEQEEELRRRLKACMSRRSLLLNGSASVGVPDPVPAPPLVNAEEWTDALSDRLTAAWRGEEEWRAWWQDQLGMNRKTKVEALRRKRRREKEAQRAAGRRLELSGSFTSSLSYQVELDEFSGSTGWSSAASQGPWSDGEGGGALSKLAALLESQEAPAPTGVRAGGPGPGPPPTSPRETPAGPRTPETPTADQGRRRRLVDDYLSSLCETQDEPPLHPAAAASSQFLTPSSASQSQRGPSQSSQPKKKRSRMGF